MSDMFNHLTPDELVKLKKLEERLDRLEKELERNKVPRMAPGRHHYYDEAGLIFLCKSPEDFRRMDRLRRLSKLYNATLNTWMSLTGWTIN